MIFASLIFLYLFLPLNLILYFFSKSTAVKNTVLLVFSLVFYAWGRPAWMLLLVFTAFCDWKNAKTIEKYRGTGKAKLALIASLVLDIGIFVAFKYSGFLAENVNALFSSALPVPELELPIGISFYTFQTLTYVIDVYRGTCKAERNLFKLALFVSFFPQLVQGPISRFNDLAKSLFEEHAFDTKVVSYGLYRILWGYFKKVVIADRILVAVNEIIQNPDVYQGGFVFVGMMFYAFELYADFTGGIDITIGIAQTMGITVTENFRRPYLSKNIKEYWKRWHITMGTWFTDYIFYPISVCKPMLKISKFSRAKFGDAVGKRVPVYLSSFVVWFTTGIWHGASWNFIVWGLMNFVVIMISQELEPLYRKFHHRFQVKDKKWYGAFEIIRTILLMSAIRMFDCYRDVPLTFKMFGNMFTHFDITALTGEAFLGLGLTGADYLLLFICLVIVVAVSLTEERKGSVRDLIYASPVVWKYIIFGIMTLVVIVFGAYGIGYDQSQFIYNQF